MVVLEGGGQFLMSEVPLYAVPTPNALSPGRSSDDVYV